MTIYGKARKTASGTLLVTKIVQNGETKMFGKYKKAVSNQPARNVVEEMLERD